MLYPCTANPCNPNRGFPVISTGIYPVGITGKPLLGLQGNPCWDYRETLLGLQRNPCRDYRETPLQITGNLCMDYREIPAVITGEIPVESTGENPVWITRNPFKTKVQANSL